MDNLKEVLITAAVSLITGVTGILIAYLHAGTKRIRDKDGQLGELKREKKERLEEMRRDADKRIDKLENEVTTKDTKIEELRSRSTHGEIANVLQAIETRLSNVEEKMKKSTSN